MRWVKNGPDALEMGCLFYPESRHRVSAAAMTDPLNPKRSRWIDSVTLWRISPRLWRSRYQPRNDGSYGYRGYGYGY
jgi:hypothetical protein